VLIDEQDVAMLCDFGIALGPQQRGDQQGHYFGTPSFMPPEQYDDPSAVTAQADLFGLGVTLFVALTGHSGMALLVAHLRPEVLAGLPANIRPVVDRATSVRVEDRYASAWEMALEIADALESTR
jgi:serine/threonine protein kinase